MDLFSYDESYRRYYTKINCGAIKPRSNISNFSTYYTDFTSKEEMKYRDLETKANLYQTGKMELEFIHDNLPTDNMRLIVKTGFGIATVFISIMNDRSISINPLNVPGFSDKERYLMTLSVSYCLCEILSKENTYIGSQEISYKNRRTGKEIPLTVTYVSRDKKPKHVSSISDNPIEWKHSWEVIGHWRVCKSIGKNRYGERVVFGKTWVNPCVKGTGKLIEKTKIIGE